MIGQVEIEEDYQNQIHHTHKVNKNGLIELMGSLGSLDGLCGSALASYKGNLLSQAINMAIKDVPEEFSPNSAHCFVTKPIVEHKQINWRVSEMGTGKTFCHRTVKGDQDNVTKFVANVSLTCKNIHSELEANYSKYLKDTDCSKEKPNEEEMSTDQEKIPSKPFYFQSTLPKFFDSNERYNMDVVTIEGTDYEVYTPSIETSEPIRLTGAGSALDTDFFVRNGNFKMKTTTTAQKYSCLLDLLCTAMMLLNKRIESSEGVPHSFINISVYFHDSEFEIIDGLHVSSRIIRLFNGKSLIEVAVYCSSQSLVATIVQEGEFLAKSPSKTSKSPSYRL